MTNNKLFETPKPNYSAALNIDTTEAQALLGEIQTKLKELQVLLDKKLTINVHYDSPLFASSEEQAKLMEEVAKRAGYTIEKKE